MFKCSSQLFRDTPSSSCAVGSSLSIHLSSAFIIVLTASVYGCTWTYNSRFLSLPGRCLTPSGAIFPLLLWRAAGCAPSGGAQVQQGKAGECLSCLATRCLCWCTGHPLAPPALLPARLALQMCFFLSSTLLISWFHWLSCRPPASRWCQKVFVILF